MNAIKKFNRSTALLCTQHVILIGKGQFSSISSIAYFSEEKSVKGQPEKMSLEPCSKLTATDGRR